ncbi:hypothetical protein VTK73DRAFT_12 [Phialemonium thermophilum]|uniref:Protein prenyltransferase alpha subunit repeat-containing protein 1 n=1 Tax=Phialemonium thermophilum TaxID=223376 RepID=A0ABR3Y7N4_9PEZI
MSRALDAVLASSLECDTGCEAYDAISEVLSLSSTSDLLDIEILGSSHILGGETYVLRDGRAVGISKIGLAQAFFTARAVLNKALRERTAAPSDEELMTATLVVLLMDPEHLTAANVRKRIIQRRLSCSSGAEGRACVLLEKRVVDSLLTSRLHRHTKSPTLWSHRRWLVGCWQSLQMRVNVLDDIVGVVAVAGERHPRNYYGWSHARWLMSLDVQTPSEEVLLATKEWCLRHRDDTSGWSFLCFLLTVTVSDDKSICSGIFREVLTLVMNLRWTNESVWVFLRTLAARGLLGDDAHAEFERACSRLIESTKDSAEQMRLQTCYSWYNTYRWKSETYFGRVL